MSRQKPAILSNRIWYTFAKSFAQYSTILLLLIAQMAGVLVFSGTARAYAPDEFVTTWKTDNPGSSGSNQITILRTGSGYNYSVDWGDGNITTGHTGNVTHTYPAPGTYTVKITGAFPHFTAGGDAQKLLTVEQWGSNQWSSMEESFRGASNLTIPAVDAPNLSIVTNMYGTFAEASSLNSDINHWDVSNVIIMGALFYQATSFNQPLDGWNVSNVTYMAGMFNGASSFNKPLSSWDVSSVTDMSNMFDNADSFNADISSWNMSNVTNIRGMFLSANSFNQPLNAWDTSSVTQMFDTFHGAISFNQPLNGWDTSNVVSMSQMFRFATSFNQPLTSWDVSGVNNMQSMFFGASAFNRSLASWDLSGLSPGYPSAVGMLTNSGISRQNYDATLMGWAGKPQTTGVLFDAPTTVYCSSVSARQYLITNYGWTITDGGEDCLSYEDPDEPDVPDGPVTNDEPVDDYLPEQPIDDLPPDEPGIDEPVEEGPDISEVQQDVPVATTPPPNVSAIASPSDPVAQTNSLFALAKRIPEPVAIGFPWLLLALALILVSIQYYQVHSESVVTKKMQAAVANQERLVEEQNNFVALTTHYLHTPLTVMEGEITLMVKAGTLTEAEATKLKATLTSLNAEAELTLAQEEQHELNR